MLPCHVWSITSERKVFSSGYGKILIANMVRNMLYMIIENFKKGNPVPIYRRFRDQGRLAPDGLKYVSSWVTSDMTKCFQLMECEDRGLLERWIARWSDIVDFEVVSVITSAQASERIAPQL